jgi:predicted fused transcriptional regulator/phosphomethylpyrimidine kinase
MCKTNSATEEKPSGSHHVDSVVLRIMIQQDNCICRVNIEYQIELVYIGLGKYDGFTSSAPVESQCGLVVDINHICQQEM